MNYCPSINGLFAQSAGGGQVSTSCSKNNPRHIKYMPTVIFFRMPLQGVGPTGRRLDLEQKSSFMEGHELMLRNV
jgi:hypothetical protein